MERIFALAILLVKQICNEIVLNKISGPTGEMNTVRAALLTLSMLSGIVFWGAGIYTADAAGDQVVDGYGVVASE